MSEIVRRTVEGRVLCDASAANCHCAKHIGHIEEGDEVHACDPRDCTGQWVGDIDGTDFKPVVMPMRVTA